MSITLYNTLTRREETLTPLVAGEISLYACGPTVYDRAHLGNARPVIVFDVLVRLLGLQHKVTYVRNITDIDDKIMNAARARGIPIETITQETTRYFHEDMAALGARPPTHEPRATQHVTHMIQMIQTLIAKGHAYEGNGHVLFDVASFKTYGALSRSNQDEILAGARVEVAPYKKHPSDFVLWKPSSDNEPGWPSPWGRGRPGWHIECSAMSQHYLGEVFDIHCGGQDLIFPHHENEIAQSCAAHGTQKMANTWMHNGILTVNGEKMSKSLGNFVTVEDLLKKAKGETIRLAVLSTHYRQALDWTDQSLHQAKAALDRFYTALQGWNGEDSEQDIDEAVLIALSQDLNTPAALARLHVLVTEIHKAEGAEKEVLQKTLKASGQLLGLLRPTAKEWFQEGTSALSVEEIEALIKARQEARQQRQFDKADACRDQLLDAGIVLEDGAQGTTWKQRS